MSYKALTAMAAAYDWKIEQMDVKTAFLYGDIEEEVYVEFPEGTVVKVGNTKDFVIKLNKALYGLKQAPRVWNNTLASYLKRLGFQPLTADLSVFKRNNIFIAVYVDDLLVIGPAKDDVTAVKRALSDRFKMSDLGPISYYLAMKVTRDRVNRTLTLGQTPYVDKVLENLGMANSHAVKVPMDPGCKLEPAPPEHNATSELRQLYIINA